MELQDLQREHTKDALKEKRISNIIINHWEKVKGDKLIAAEKDLDPVLLDPLLDNCFMLSASELAEAGKYKYIYIGKNILDAYGSRVTSPKDYHDVDPLSNKKKFKELMEKKVPIMEEGQFINKDGDVVKYRQCLVPLGSDGVTIETILGGMRFKVFHS
jgi:hypothetical protein